MSRADLKRLGEVIDAGQAALVIVAEDTLEPALRKVLKAGRRVAKQIRVSQEDVDQAVQ